MNKTERKARLRELDRITKIDPESHFDVMPSEVWVAANYFEITIDEGLRDRDRLGECYPDMGKILINPNQSPQSLRASLLHEVLHAVFHEFVGTRYGAGKLKLTEEQLVRQITSGLIDVLRVNRDLTFFLMAHTG